MLKHIDILLFFICYSSLSIAQNLVPNYSFEQYDSCPSEFSQINLALPWFQPNVCCGTGGSSDYYNFCAPSGSDVKVPNNVFGYQNARTGVGYAGVVFYNSIAPPTGGREYLEVELINPLISGKFYSIEVYLSRAENTKYVTDAVGLYFSQDSTLYNDINWSNLPFIPQIKNPQGNILYDSTGWSLVSGYYIATGGEKFITIGNFYPNSNTLIDTVSGTGYSVAYYYIDDISVIQHECDTTPPVAKFNYTADTLTATFNNLSSAFSNYWFWDFGDGKTDTIYNPVHTYDSAGVYIVTLIAWYNGCSDTMTVQVTVSDVGERELRIKDYRFKIYPNPNDGAMSMDYSLAREQKGELIIYDLTGKKLKSFTLNSEYNTIRIDIQELYVGIYLYKITVDREVVAFDKLIIIK